MGVAPTIEISESMRQKLTRYSKSSNVSSKLSQRSKIVLMAAEGNSNKSITAYRSGSGSKKWRKRFVELGLRGTEKGAPRPGRFKPVGGQREKSDREKP